MILLIGEDGNETMSTRLFETLRDLDRDVIWINQSSFPIEHRFTLTSATDKLSGYLYIESEDLTIDINTIQGIYTRLNEVKLESHFENSEKEIIQSERGIAIDILYNYIETAVINRSQAQRSNGSKIFQTWLVHQFGFKVPQSLVTNNPDHAKAFWQQFKKNGIIYKSCSAQRSIVHKLDEKDISRLDHLQKSPVLFQEYIAGTDLRVHALATGETFASEIVSDSSDYRYDKERSIKAITLPETIQKACVNLTRSLGLYIAGIDLRVTPNGDYYCFEANPSPVFTWYEDQSGQNITAAVAKMLIHGKELYQSNIVERMV